MVSDTEHMAPTKQAVIGELKSARFDNALHNAPAPHFIITLQMAANSAFQSNPL